MEHLLKRCYVLRTDCYRGWEVEIRNFRQRLQIELEDSPSLKNFMVEILPKSYGMALDNVQEDYPDTVFPQFCPFPADMKLLLTERFWR